MALNSLNIPMKMIISDEDLEDVLTGRRLSADLGIFDSRATFPWYLVASGR
jgi:hypothetical protein